MNSETRIVQSLTATAAHTDDVTEVHNLLHGGETIVWCNGGYHCVHKGEGNLGLEVEWRWRCGLVSVGSWSLAARKVVREVESVGEGHGGASLPEAAAAVRMCQGSLLGPGAERREAGVAARAGRPAGGLRPLWLADPGGCATWFRPPRKLGSGGVIDTRQGTNSRARVSSQGQDNSRISPSSDCSEIPWLVQRVCGG